MILSGQDNYSVIVRSSYDSEVFIQARSESEALSRASTLYPEHKIISATLRNSWWLESHKS